MKKEAQRYQQSRVAQVTCSFVILMTLLTGPLSCTEMPSPNPPPVASTWPPRNAQDLVLLLQGADPQCSGTFPTRNSTVANGRWIRLILSQSKMLLGSQSGVLLYKALKTFIQSSQDGGSQGHLKDLLLWSISQNMSWEFLGMPLVSHPSSESPTLSVSLKSDLATFLLICSGRLLPALRDVCTAIIDTHNNTLKTLCSFLNSTNQTNKTESQVCGFLYALLTDLLSDPCKSPSSRTVRSVDANCDYSLWQNGSTVPPSSVSTCSYSDQEGFINFVCKNTDLLMQLSSSNDWLTGFCSYNTNPAIVCNYMSWQPSNVPAMSVQICWASDSEQFEQYLCSNPDVLQELRLNPDNAWLDPTCSTVAPTEAISPTLLQEVCNYGQWQPDTTDPYIVVLCAENDQNGFSAYACQSPEILQQLQNSSANLWLSSFCEMYISLVRCNYSEWQKIPNRDVLMQSDGIAPPDILLCSQMDEKNFVTTVCSNVTFLLFLAKNPNNSWLLDFCPAHMLDLQDVCNYTSWRSIDFTNMSLCWLFDQEQMESYLYKDSVLLQQLKLNGPSELYCAGSSRSISYFTQWDKSPGNSSLLLSWAVHASSSFKQHICSNATAMAELISDTKNYWIPIFCNGGSSNNNYDACSAMTLSRLLSMCPNCSKPKTDVIVLLVCTNQDPLQTLGPSVSSLNPVTQFYIWKLCSYGSWSPMSAPIFLVYFCWTFDPVNFTSFMCNNPQFCQKTLQNPDNSLVLSGCHLTEGCQYADWDAEIVTNDSLYYCAQSDFYNFSHTICTNSNFLQALAQYQNLSWVTAFCTNSSVPSKVPKFCAYIDWSTAEFFTVSSCIINDTVNFLLSACNNPWIMHGISEGPALTLTLSFCYNISDANTLQEMLTWNVCNYSYTNAPSPFLVEFCWLYDQENFSQNLCSNYTLLQLIKSQPENFYIQVDCVPPAPAEPSLNYSVIQCRYEQWHLTLVDISLLRFCTNYDKNNFLITFCNNTGAPQANGSLPCAWGNDMCSYQSWKSKNIHPFIVQVCWDSDRLNFTAGVCTNASLFTDLLKNPANLWLRPACNTHYKTSVEEMVAPLCRYEKWGSLETQPGSLIAFCKAYDTENYMLNVSGSQEKAFYKESSLSWIVTDQVCGLDSLINATTDYENVFICWLLERDAFLAQVCAHSDLLSSDPRTKWILHFCKISLSSEPAMCLSEQHKTQLQWNCSADLSSVCPGSGLTVGSVIPLILCSMQNAGLTVDNASITALYMKAVDTTVILLLLLEEMQVLSLSGFDMIQAEVLRSVRTYLTNDLFNNEQKKDFLCNFGNVLIQQAGGQVSSESWILTEEFFKLPLSDMGVCISHLTSESAKVILNNLSQNKTSLQVPAEYYSFFVSSLLKNQVSIDMVLLIDLVPFLHYLDPDEMFKLLPPVYDNSEVLLALSSSAGSFSIDQRIALGLWLQNSAIFKNISCLSDSVIQEVGNLLPLLPLNKFQELNPHQVLQVLPYLTVDMSSPYQRIILSKVFQVPNVTAQDMELLGPYLCQADVKDLWQFQQNQNIFVVLQRSLLECVKQRELYPDSKMLDFLFRDVPWRYPESLSWQSVSTLAPVLPSLGVTFLQSLRLEQILPALANVGSVSFTPAQARELVQKILNKGPVSDDVLSHMGSMVLGLSPTFLQQLSAKQIIQLLPALTVNVESMSPTQRLAVLKKLWVGGNMTDKLQDLGSLLHSLPLIQLRTQVPDLLSNLPRVAVASWNMQQAQFLFRENSKRRTMQEDASFLGNLLAGVDCNSLSSFLSDNITQTLKQLCGMKVPLASRLIHCVVDQLNSLPLTVELLNNLNPQIGADILHSKVSTLGPSSCRSLLKGLKSQPQFVTALPLQRQLLLLDALSSCLGLAGTSSPQEIFVGLGVLSPFLKTSTFLSVSRGTLVQTVESVTHYCFPPKTQILLTSLLQEPQEFGPPNLWIPTVLERLDRLVPLFPDQSLQSLNTSTLSTAWVLMMFSKDYRWRSSPLGVACTNNESPQQRANRISTQSSLLQHSLLASSARGAVFGPECQTLQSLSPSAMGANVLLGMSNEEFMDCLEVIGGDPDIPFKDLSILFAKLLKIVGPVSNFSPLLIARLGRLATQISSQKLERLPLGNMQVMEALGKEKEWDSNQLQVLASGFLQSSNLSTNRLDSLQLVALGYAVCGLQSTDLQKLPPLEFCSAVLHLGSLSLSCTEEQLYILTRICAKPDMFGPVSGWTEDIFREMGTLAAGLQDIELSSLVQEQIGGLSSLALSLLEPKKFAVFSPAQLRHFSWSQASGVTEQQAKLLDKEQLKALSMVLTGQEDGNPSYRAGMAPEVTSALFTLFLCCWVLSFLQGQLTFIPVWHL